MFRITDNKIITLTRGDSAKIAVSLNLNTKSDPQLYELTANDVVYLGIMEPNKPFEKAIVRKAIYGEDNVGKDSVDFILDPIDTEFLMPGTYSYSVKLFEPTGEEEKDYHVHTILDKRKFTIID